ncbi:hypothetical protein K7432_005549 [Basidiobolus ranarum]|uniref:SAM domain-containing protein n=1 Tax=Basidiobolus ranarum TaxID=34480 RepID=A0ABR2W2Y2_9FUNG
MRKRTSISPNDLHRLKRSELQSLCRKHDIKGLTRKNTDLIADLRAAFLERQKDEISDVELSDFEGSVNGDEEQEEHDRSDLLDELTFAPSALTKKVLTNLSYAKEIPATRIKPETKRLTKPKKAYDYSRKIVESDEEDPTEAIQETTSQDTDMNDSFVFTFDKKAPKVSKHEDQEMHQAMATVEPTKSIIKPVEPSFSKPKEVTKTSQPFSTNIGAKLSVSNESSDKPSNSIVDQASIAPKQKQPRPKRLVRHTVAAKPFEIKVPKGIQSERIHQDSKVKSEPETSTERVSTLPAHKNDELFVDPEPKPIAHKKRQREYDINKEANPDILEEKPKSQPLEHASKTSKYNVIKTESSSAEKKHADLTSHAVKPQQPDSTFSDPFVGEEVSEWLERINLSPAIRTFERENMMDWKLVQLLTFEHLGVMGFTVGDALKLLLALKDKFPQEMLVQSNPLSHSQIIQIQQIVDERVQAALGSYSQPIVKPKVTSAGSSIHPKPSNPLQQTLHSQPQTNNQQQAQPQTRPKVSSTITNALSSNVSAGLLSSTPHLGLSISADANDRRDSIPKGNTIQKRTLWEKSVSQPKESTVPSKINKTILHKSTTTRQPIGKRLMENRTIRGSSVDLSTTESPAKKRRFVSIWVVPSVKYIFLTLPFD